MVYAYAPLGLKGKLVQVEVDICGSIPGVEIVGLPSSEVKEARERVKIAIRKSGFVWPQKKILINLAPADVKKQGSGFDLPIALGILIATKQIAGFEHAVMSCGELQLNGTIRPITAGLSAVIAALEYGITHFVFHESNTKEGSITQHGSYLTIGHLSELQQSYTWSTSGGLCDEIDGHDSLIENTNGVGMADLSYSKSLKRVMTIAAAGRHNVLLCGPPGTGKTASAIRLASLLPKLSFAESLEVSSLYSQSGISIEKKGLIQQRPVRIPHHTASVEGMIGSSSSNALGEISLAHLGVLLLDEAPEFKARVLQALREPLDQHTVLISRAGQKWECPADFQLLLTTNLCPCGNFGKPQSLGEWCMCSEQEIFRYWKKIGAALWDRIDIKFSTQYRTQGKEENKLVRLHDMVQRKIAVRNASDIQKQRYEEAHLHNRWNSRCPSDRVYSLFSFSKEAHRSIQHALTSLGISERRKVVLYRVAQTIADVENEISICKQHVDEAVQLVNFKQQQMYGT